MTRIEELFLKVLDELDANYNGSIDSIDDLKYESYLTPSEYQEVIDWRNQIKFQIRDKKKSIVEAAKSKLTPEEIEAIKEVGI